MWCFRMDGCEFAAGQDMAGDRTAWSASKRTLPRVRVSVAWVLALALCVSGGCRVGPDHGPPSAPLSNQWKHPREPGPVNGVDVCDPWWSEFRDPVLDSLIQRAVAANPGLQEACFRVLEARARRGVVTGERFPEIEGTGGYSFKKVSGNSSPYTLTSQDSFSLFSTGLDAAWELDLWGKYRRAIEAADAELGVAGNDYGFVRLTLLGDVAATYVELRTYQERIAVAHQNVKIQERTLRLAQERHRAGLTKPLDAAQAKSSLHATKATIPALEIGLQQAENRLCVLLGEAPRDLQAQLGATQPIPAAPRELALGLPADLLRRRPDVRGAELKVAAESARIGVAVADLYPQLSLTGTISVDSTDISDLFTPQSIAHKVGPSLTWNILSFGRIRNKIHAQGARFQQAVRHYQTTVLAAAEEVENALASCARERERSESLVQAVASAEESVRLAELYYGQGLASFQSVLDSQRSLLALQDRLTVSRANVTLNGIALYKALGGGWKADASGIQTDHDLSPAVAPEVMRPSDAQRAAPSIHGQEVKRGLPVPQPDEPDAEVPDVDVSDVKEPGTG